MSVECQVNVKSQSELDIGGRETCICFLLKMEINNLYFLLQMGMMKESSQLSGTRITEASSG